MAHALFDGALNVELIRGPLLRLFNLANGRRCLPHVAVNTLCGQQIAMSTAYCCYEYLEVPVYRPFDAPHYKARRLDIAPRVLVEEIPRPPDPLAVLVRNIPLPAELPVPRYAGDGSSTTSFGTSGYVSTSDVPSIITLGGGSSVRAAVSSENLTASSNASNTLCECSVPCIPSVSPERPESALLVVNDPVVVEVVLGDQVVPELPGINEGNDVEMEVVVEDNILYINQRSVPPQVFVTPPPDVHIEQLVAQQVDIMPEARKEKINRVVKFVAAHVIRDIYIEITKNIANRLKLNIDSAVQKILLKTEGVHRDYVLSLIQKRVDEAVANYHRQHGNQDHAASTSTAERNYDAGGDTDIPLSCEEILSCLRVEMGFVSPSEGED
jgi:hypothetical protein